MNKHSFLVATVLGWLVAGGPLQSLAQNQAGRPYFWAEGGPAWTQDTDLKQFAYEPTPGSELEFDTGFHFGLGAGYHVTDWFAAEFETGVVYNSAELVGVNSWGDMAVSQVPFLVNVVFSVPNDWHIIPFIGGGVGGVSTLLNLDDFAVDLPGSVTYADGSFSDFVFAYQGFAGVRYEFTENMSLALSYKFLGSEGPEWEADTFVEENEWPYYGFWTTTETKAGSFRTHSVNLTFRFTF